MDHDHQTSSVCRCLHCQTVPYKAHCNLQTSCKKNAKIIIKTLSLIIFYYIFSIGLTFYNKWMFKGFHFPLMTTCIHFSTVFILSALSRVIFSPCRKSVPTLEWLPYLKKVFITGIASALDIGLSNWSFVFITVSLYTMVKSSCVVFILGFALALKLEKPRFSLVIIVCLISGGLFLFVYESSEFDLEGFILVLSASFIGGIRWTLSQIIAQKKELGLSNPIDLLYHLQPTMFVGLFPLALAHEGLSFFTSKRVFAYETFSDVTLTVIMIVVGGGIAFMLSFSEYLLLTNTSSLTLSISGIFKVCNNDFAEKEGVRSDSFKISPHPYMSLGKEPSSRWAIFVFFREKWPFQRPFNGILLVYWVNEIITLIMATTWNKNHLSPMNWLGFFICVSGISLHVLLKFLQRNEKTDDDSKNTEEDIRMELLHHSDTDSDNETELFNFTKR